jgi:hypothetical protein
MLNCKVHFLESPDRTSSGGGTLVSIVRVGLAETKQFSEGYDAIFGRKKAGKARKSAATAKTSSAKKKKVKKK